MIRFVLEMALLLAVASLAHAEDEHDGTGESGGEPTEEMIVTGSRVERSREVIPVSSTVLDGKGIEDGISLGIADALRFVPGLHVTRDGARGGRTAFYLRGLDPNHVVVMIDGVRLNDPTNPRGGSFDPTTLALVDTERVEIVRGPQSSIYGSDALAGTINVVTRRVGQDEEPTATIEARGGRFHAGQVMAQATGGVGGVAGVSLGASLDTFRDPNSDGGFDGASIKGKIDAALSEAVRFQTFARVHRSSARSFPASSGGPELARLRQLEDRNVREVLFGASLETTMLEERGRLTLRASRSSRREEVDSPGIDGPGIVPPSRSGDEYKRWDLSLVSDWKMPSFPIRDVEVGTRVVAGADAAWEDGESDTYLDFGGGFSRFPFFDNRRTIGIFGELEESIGQIVVVSASVRYDTTPDEQDRLSPAAGLTIKIPGTRASIFGNYGEGFKRPSFFALGNPLVGNPSLEIEKSRGWELGLRFHSPAKRFRGQISYFDVEVKNLIDFDSATFSLSNRQRLVSRGVEAEMTWDVFEWLEWSAGATFNPTDIRGIGRDVENRPSWRGFAEFVVRPIDEFEVQLRTLAVGSSKASAAQTGGAVTTLQGYARIDLRIGWFPVERLQIFFEIENLTDQTYREAVGFEAPGIAPRLGLTVSL